MDYTSMIQSKMSKVERSLSELNDEIITATKYLLQLKENSAAVVENLNNITTPKTYLKEFLNVNTFLLNSIGFLTEFNCKIEMLDISKNSLLTSCNKSPPVVAKMTSDSEETADCEFVEQLKSNIGREVSIKDEKQTEMSKSVCRNQNRKRKKKKKSRGLQSQLPEKKNNCKEAAKVIVTAVNNDDTINKKSSSNASFKSDNKISLKASEVNQKNYLSGQSNSETSLDVKVNNSEMISSIKKVDANGSQTKKVLNSKEQILTNYSDYSNNYKITETSLVGNIVSKEENVSSTEVSQPKKIKDWWYQSSEQSDESEDFSCNENSDSDNLKGSQCIVENSNEIGEIKPTKLVGNLGEEYNIVIENIISPSEFYVSIIEGETSLLKELENKLKLIPPNKNVSCNNKSEVTKAGLSKEIGNYALVYSKCDEIWCRAKITNWCLNYSDSFVNVFLLDYGESKCVSIYDLQVMPKHLKQFPSFTVRCHLHNVFPVDMNRNSSTISWEREASEQLKSLTENSKKIKMKVAPSDCYHPESSVPVSLWLVDEGNKCVNELLVKSKCAVHGSAFENLEKESESMKTHLVENGHLSEWNPMKEDYESYKNSYDLDVNDPASIIYGYVGKDYERVCKHFAKSGYCFKGASCKKEHKRLDHLGFTTDQEEVYQNAINKLVIPPPKSKLTVQVTCLLECNKFCCFLEDRSSSFDEENLQGLLQFMNKKENILEMKKLLIPPSAGQIVIARYSEDKAWYRARILESQPEIDEYAVLFVDYGNRETLPLSEIRAMEARYLHLPFQAIQCSIFGIRKNPKASQKEVMDFMKERMDDGHITIEVVAKLPGDNINLLVNVFDQNGVDIGMDLIFRNYAVSTDEMVVNFASESVPG